MILSATQGCRETSFLPYLHVLPSSPSSSVRWPNHGSQEERASLMFLARFQVQPLSVLHKSVGPLSTMLNLNLDFIFALLLVCSPMTHYHKLTRKLWTRPPSPVSPKDITIFCSRIRIGDLDGEKGRDEGSPSHLHASQPLSARNMKVCEVRSKTLCPARDTIVSAARGCA